MNKQDRIQVLLKKLQKKVNTNLFHIPLEVFYSGGKRKNNKRMYIKINIDGLVIFGKFPLNKNDKMVVKEAYKLRRISTNQFSIPEVILPVGKGFFMTSIKGCPIEFILKKRGLPKSMEILKETVRRIARFHRATEIEHVFFKDKLDIYSKLTGQNPRDFQKKDLLKEVSIGYMHGDLDPFNMFFDAKTNNYGLIDWEDFREKGIQELDILHFLIMIAVILCRKKDFINLYQKIFLKNNSLSRTIMRLLSEYCIIQKKNPHSIINLLPIYCDTQIYRLVKTGRNQKGFLYGSFKNLFQEKGYKTYL